MLGSSWSEAGKRLWSFVVVSQTGANVLEAENTSLLTGTSLVEATVATSKLIPSVLRM